MKKKLLGFTLLVAVVAAMSGCVVSEGYGYHHYHHYHHYEDHDHDRDYRGY